jgi:hypothetical protein
MKKRKKAPQDVALMTGNPNDIVVVSPEEKPVKYQTEAAQAIKQLKSKLKAPEFVYLAPTEKVEVDKKAEKQARDIKKLVSKLSTQEVTEEDLNALFGSVKEGAIKSILGSPFRAAGLLGRGIVKTATAATLLSTPTTAAIYSADKLNTFTKKLSQVGKQDPSKDSAEKMSKYHTAIMKQRVAQSKEQTKQSKQATSQSKIATAQAAKRLNALDDIKKTVNQKITRYNAANKGKDSIQTYTKTGTSTPPKSTPTTTSSNTAPSIIIPSTYRTRSSTSNTTIVSHREWDREKYMEEKNQLALQKKAEKYGVDIEVVETVFKQGLVEYDDRGNATINQFAMQKVNSFLANYLEEKKTIMVGGKRRRILGEPPGAVYARKAIKTSGKTTVVKKGKTIHQRLNRAVTTLKRKLKQKALRVEEHQLDERGLWDNIHAKRKRIKAGSGEKMRKPGSESAPTKQNLIDAQENVNESFIVDRAAGYSTTYTAADLGIKIQGGFELHPSVTEEGGAGDEGTDKLVRKYKKDTPGEALEQMQRTIRARRKANTQC